MYVNVQEINSENLQKKKKNVLAEIKVKKIIFQNGGKC